MLVGEDLDIDTLERVCDLIEALEQSELNDQPNEATYLESDFQHHCGYDARDAQVASIHVLEN